jgi:hypothetical protein
LNDSDVSVSTPEMFQSLHDITLVKLDYGKNKRVYKVSSVRKDIKNIAIALGVKLKI